MISLQGKTNFFEMRVGEYAKSGVGGAAEDNRRSFEANPFQILASLGDVAKVR